MTIGLIYDGRVETLVRRAAAVLVACETLFLASLALFAWELAGGLHFDPGPPTPASQRLAAAAPYLFLLPWFVIGAVVLWSGHRPTSTPWRLAEGVVLSMVAAGNLFAIYYVMEGPRLDVDGVINATTAAAALAVAGVCALVAMGRLRDRPLED